MNLYPPNPTPIQPPVWGAFGVLMSIVALAVVLLATACVPQQEPVREHWSLAMPVIKCTAFGCTQLVLDSDAGFVWR